MAGFWCTGFDLVLQHTSNEEHGFLAAKQVALGQTWWIHNLRNALFPAALAQHHAGGREMCQDVTWSLGKAPNFRWLAWAGQHLEPLEDFLISIWYKLWMEKLQASHRLGVAGHKGATSARICHHLIRQQHGHVEFFTHLYGGTSSGGQDPKNIIWSILSISWTRKTSETPKTWKPRLLQFVHDFGQLLLPIRQLTTTTVIHTEATHDRIHHQQSVTIFIIHLPRSLKPSLKWNSITFKCKPLDYLAFHDHPPSFPFFGYHQLLCEPSNSVSMCSHDTIKPAASTKELLQMLRGVAPCRNRWLSHMFL